MPNKQLQREIIENRGMTLSKGTNDISDILSSIHHFLRHKKVALKGVEVEAILVKIEEFFYFEEMSGWKEIDGFPANLSPDPFVEDVYYGHAFVKEENSHEALEYLHETLAPLLNELAPEGYAFTSLEGSSSEIGFYAVTED